MQKLLTYSYPEVKTQNKSSPLDTKEHTLSNQYWGDRVKGGEEPAVSSSPDAGLLPGMKEERPSSDCFSTLPTPAAHSHPPASHSRRNGPTTSWTACAFKSSWDSIPLQINPGKTIWEREMTNDKQDIHSSFYRSRAKHSGNSYQMMWPSHKLPLGGRRMLNNPNPLWGNRFTLFFIVTFLLRRSLQCL